MSTLFYLLTPFSYLEAGGLRVVVLQALIGFLAVVYSLLKKPSVVISPSLLVLGLLIFLSAFYAFVSGDYSNLAATVVFFILLLCSYSFAACGNSNLERSKNLYVFSCVFVALGLILQFSLHRIFDISLFRHILFGGNRNAYSFIWMDFSFISLYVVSCLPIVFAYKRSMLVAAISILLIFASIVTSARTGIAAIVLLVLLNLIFYFVNSMLSGSIRLRHVFFIIPVFLVPLIFFYALPFFTGRTLTVSSSGRIADFIVGFDFFKSNVLFGAYMDKHYYSEQVAFTPHNLFAYAVIMGGVLYFLLFCLFILATSLEIMRADKNVLSSVFLCFLGFQFIPSFFSAYFFAILLGIAMASSKLSKKTSITQSKCHA